MMTWKSFALPHLTGSVRGRTDPREWVGNGQGAERKVAEKKEKTVE
jgi:hypothetical protein